MMQEIHMTAIYWPIIAFKKHEILASVHVILRHFPSGTNWPPTCRVEVLPCTFQCKHNIVDNMCDWQAARERNLRRILKESKKKKGIGLKVCPGNDLVFLTLLTIVFVS